VKDRSSVLMANKSTLEVQGKGIVVLETKEGEIELRDVRN